MADSSLDEPGQGGQGHGDGGNVRHQQQGHDDSEEIRQQFLDDLLNLDMAHLAAGEQDGTHRRGDGADAQVHADHDAELDGVHPEGLADGQEDRGENQDGGGGVHEGADDQQDDVHQGEDEVLVAGEGEDAVGDQVGQTGEGHDPGHDGGQADHQGDEVKLPEIVTDQDIAGTIAVSVDGESFCYVDVLVYKLGYYAPTAFALKMLIDIFAVSLPTACIAALIFAAIFSRRVAGSTKMILRALDDIANGNYDVELPKQKIVEYGKIAASIRTLASDLERHGRSRKEWIRNISHDLNTPVTALTLLINGIEEGVFQPDEQIIGQLKEQTDILAERIASVNYYSYLLSPDVPVDRVLLNAISVFSEAGIKCNTCFDIDEGSKAVDVWADEKLLMRAAEEILYNAGEYSSGDKKIVIRCFYDKASAVITVRNSGKLPDPRPQFFEPWARGDDSRTSGGSGLGLPIVYQIMELHSGAVSIDESDGFVEVRLVFPLPSSSDES